MIRKGQILIFLFLVLVLNILNSNVVFAKSVHFESDVTNLIHGSHIDEQDVSRPTVQIISIDSDSTNERFIDVSFVFSEPVTGFELEDIISSNVNLDRFNIQDPSNYTVRMRPIEDGEVTLQIPENVAQDASGNENLQSETYQVIFDGTSPIVEFSSTSLFLDRYGSLTAKSNLIPVTIKFSEPVYGFSLADFTTNSNLEITNLNGSGKEYTIDLTTTSGSGNSLSFQLIDRSSVKDAAGNTAEGRSFRFGTDFEAPKVISITSYDGEYVTGDEVPMRIHFNEDVLIRSNAKLRLETSNENSLATSKVNLQSNSDFWTRSLELFYIVDEGDESLDLSYLNETALSFEGALPEDGARNELDLTLPKPGEESSLSFNQDIKIDGSVPYPPTFTSANSASLNENTAGVVHQFSTDSRMQITYAFSAVGAKETFFFEIVDNQLLVNQGRSGLDFERPLDRDRNNDYEMLVYAIDELGRYGTQEFTVNILDVDDSPPVFNIAEDIVFKENSVDADYFVSVSDQSEVTFSIEEPLSSPLELIDSEFFEIDAQSGRLTFKSPPDFEDPQDVSKKNRYTVKIKATDSFDNSSITVLSVFVENLNDEIPQFISLPTLRVRESETYNYTVSSVDPDGSAITINASTIPSWLTLQTETAGEVSNVAGSIKSTLNDSGIETSFNNSEKIAIDLEGNIYIADGQNYRIVKVSPLGELTTFAGTGISGFKNGPKEQAQFVFPYDLVFDSEGNLFVSDGGDPRIRKIDKEGNVSTFAGNASRGYENGVGVDATFAAPGAITIDKDDNLYLVDDFSIRKITPNAEVSLFAGNPSDFGSSNGKRTEARFGRISDLKFDNQGNLIIADRVFGNVRKIDVNGIVSNLAGGAERGFNDGIGDQASFYTPYGIAIDIDNNIYVADAGNHAIRQISSNNEVTTFVGKDNDLSATLKDVRALEFDKDNNLVALDYELGILYKFSESEEIQTLAGRNKSVKNTIGSESTFNTPYDVAADAQGNIFVADTENHLIRKIDREGNVTTYAGTGEVGMNNGISTEATFNRPVALEVDSSGNIFVVESGNHSVRKISNEGLVSTVAGNGQRGFLEGEGSQAQFSFPSDLALLEDGSILVADSNNNRIRKIDNTGVVLTYAGNGENNTVDPLGRLYSINSPTSLELGPNGEVFVVSSYNIIREIKSDGAIFTLSQVILNGIPFNDFKDVNGQRINISVRDLLYDPRGFFYFSDPSGNQILKIQNDVVSVVAGSGQSGSINATGQMASFRSPWGIAFDTDGNLIVADVNNHRIRKMTTGVTLLAGDPNGQLGTHEVELIASDESGASLTQSFEIVVIGADEIIFNSADEVTIPENSTDSFLKVSADGSSSLNYSIDQTQDGNVFNINSITGELEFKETPDFEEPRDIDQNNEYVFNIIATDSNGNNASQSITLIVTNVDDDAPVFTSSSNINFIENGTGVAYTITSDDVDAVYSLGTGNDEGDFSLTGAELTFITAPDFETKNSYVINVIAADALGNSSNQDVTITITDVDEIAPVINSATSIDFAENRTGVAYTIIATDDSNITYSLGTGNDEANFMITGAEVTFKTAPDFETKSSYVINVIATDALGNASNQDVTITITDVDEIDPVITSGATASFAENATGVAYTITATDDSNITYSLGTGNDEAAFTLTGSELTFITTPDFETKNSYVVNVIATDALGNASNQDVMISISDANDAPTDISLSTVLVDENSDQGILVGTLSSTDIDEGNDTFTYSLVSGEGNTDNAAFSIADNELVTNADIDFEAKSSYSIRLRTDDGFEGTYEEAFIITVNDVNEVATDIAIDNLTIAENLAIGTEIDALSTTDPDTGDTHTYTLVEGEGDTDNSNFEIEDGKLVAKASFDFETKSSYSVRVQSTDAGGLSLAKAFALSILDANDAPDDITLSSAVLDENVEQGTAVATLLSTDIDEGNDSFTYTLVSGEGDTDNAAFNIADNELVTNADIDFEAKSSYSIRLRTDDGFEGTYEEVFTITVNDVNEVATDISIDNLTIAENLAAGTEIDALSTTDPDVGDTHTYTLVAGEGDTDNSNFDIADGKLVTKERLNFESKSSYSVRVQTTDLGGLSYAEAFNITVTDANDAPTALAVSNLTVAENEPIGIKIGNMSTTDEDASDTYTYALVAGDGDTDNSLFKLEGGELQASASFNFESKASYGVRIQSTDAGGLSTVDSFVITITDANDTPTDISASNLILAENEAEGTVIGDFSSTDEDASDTYSYSLVSGEGDTDNAQFAIADGQLKSAVSLNFEEQENYSIRVKTTDAGGASFEKEFTVSVTNVIETLFNAVSPTIDNTQLGQVVEVDIAISNGGEDAMQITEVNYPEGFSGSLVSTNIDPSRETTLSLVFAPTEAKTYSGNIELITNGGTEVISVVAVGEIVTAVDNGLIDPSKITLYPNPADDVITIDLTAFGGKPVDLTLLNSQGQRLDMSKGITKDSQIFEVKQYMQGVYIIMAETEKQGIRKKFIIKR